MKSRTRTSNPKPGALTGRAFDAMTPAQRQKIIDEIDRSTPEQLGKGTRIVSVMVEVDVLKKADAFAATRGLKRSELFTQALRKVLAA